MDIASVTAGQSAGNFFSGLSVPDGTYNYVRVTPSTTFKMKGSAGGYYTTTGTLSVSGRTVILTGDSANLAEGTIILADDDVPYTESSLSPAITVKNGVADHKVRVSFDVSNTLEYYDADTDYFLAAAPTVTMTVE